MEAVPSPSTTAVAAAGGAAGEYYPIVEGQLMPIVIPQAHKEFYDRVEKVFKITFKSNEKNVKHPNQVVADDTFHCGSKKAVCVYLGDKIPPLEGVGYPMIHAYLKFHDDKIKDSVVQSCPKHNTLSASDQNHRASVLCTQSANFQYCYDDAYKQAYVHVFKYPVNEERPSISLSFGCLSSCFGRAVFELNVELVYPAYIFQAKHLVKVSANPGRDCGSNTVQLAVDGFARVKGAFGVSTKPRARKHTSSSDSEPSPKRAAPEPEDGPELPENGIFNLTIYGVKDYQFLLDQYNTRLIKDKYRQIKTCPAQAVILNSQIPETADLDNYLEKARLKRYKQLLNSHGINTMTDLHKAYHRRYFEDLMIPVAEARVLHSSFIYWQTSFLNRQFNGSQSDE